MVDKCSAHTSARSQEIIGMHGHRVRLTSEEEERRENEGIERDRSQNSSLSEEEKTSGRGEKVMNAK